MKKNAEASGAWPVKKYGLEAPYERRASPQPMCGATWQKLSEPLHGTSKCFPVLYLLHPSQNQLAIEIAQMRESYARSAAPWAFWQAETIWSRIESASLLVRVPNERRRRMVSNWLFLPVPRRSRSR